MFPFFKKKDKENISKMKETGKKESGIDGSFAFGVQDTFNLKESNDLVVIGRVRGTVKPDMAVYISNFGDDEGPITLSVIRGLEINAKQVSEAADCLVALRIEGGKLANIKIGTVIYTRDISTKDVHDAYVAAIGDSYIIRKDMDLIEEDLNKMSITDCAESWRLYNWFHSKDESNTSNEVRETIKKKVYKLADALGNKILQANEIYTVYNKLTGEPHLFSKTLKQSDGTYLCTPPDIMIISKPYAKPYEAMYPANRFEIRKIENGEDKKGIYNFLGSIFYLNGACGIKINFEEIGIDAAKLVLQPDYAAMPEIQIPITNPDLERWLLLIGQLGTPNTEAENLIYKLYYRFMSRELLNAKLLIPIKTDGDIPVVDETGKAILKEDFKFGLAMCEGKYGRNAVKMFTDWKRLRLQFGEEWSGLIQPISGMIELFDCMINATEFSAVGAYIGEELYEDIKNYVS